jgi:carbamoyl-phosphate synthase large subunit
MRSTGEVMSFASDYPTAFAKAQVAAGNPLPTEGTVLVSLADSDKREGSALVSQLAYMGFSIVATRGTARVLRAMGINAAEVLKVGEGRPDVVDLIAQGGVSLVVNTPTSDERDQTDLGVRLPAGAQPRGAALALADRRTVGYRIRAAALQYHASYITTLVALRAAVTGIRAQRTARPSVAALHEIVARGAPAGGADG